MLSFALYLQTTTETSQKRVSPHLSLTLSTMDSSNQLTNIARFYEARLEAAEKLLEEEKEEECFVICRELLRSPDLGP